ncbi:MAG: hypothetical protein JW874_02805 [Spirochaetales bacterium]|nr:hypothetical protein [Spirochaetales bacterium]
MDDPAFYGVLIINSVILVRNSALIISGKIEPSLAMWAFFSIAVTGSLVSYLLDGHYSPLDNILNTSDIVLCLVQTAVIFIFGGKKARFNKFEYFCLSAVLLILVFWIFSKAHFVTNLGLQLILVIAYIPVYYRMIRAGKNTESFVTWGLLSAISLLSLLTAKGTLAYVYSLRSMICTGALLVLMGVMQMRWKRRMALHSGEKK